MATVIQTLTNKKTGDIVLPRSITTAINTADGSGLENKLVDLTAKSVSFVDELSTSTLPRDADTLDGQLPSYYAKASDIPEPVDTSAFALKITPMVTVTASKTLSLTDGATMQMCDSSSDIVITIPSPSNVEFLVGTEISFMRYGTGAVSFIAETGSFIISSESKVSIANQYEVAVIKKINDGWVLFGSLA